MLRKILTLFLFVSPLFAQTNTFIPGGNVNSQTNSYTAVATDVGKIIEMNCSACTLTLPNPPPFPSWTIYPKNINASNLTISPNAVALDHSSSNAFVTQGQWLTITTDGNVYTSLASGGGSSGGGGVTPPSACVTVNPPSIPFGTVQNGTISDPQLVTINNNCTAPIIINSVTLPVGSKFSGNLHTCDGPQDPGGCSLLISYAPTASVTDNDTLTVSTNVPVDPQSPLTVPLSGTGQPGATFPVTVTGFGLGSGTVIDTNNANSINANINAGRCTGTCTFNYPSGTSVSLAATANAGSSFNIFQGASLTTSPGTFTVTQAQTISATFDVTPRTFTLTVSCAGQGTGTVTSNDSQISATCTGGVLTGTNQGTYNDGAAPILTESPSGGCAGGACTFTAWGGDQGTGGLNCTTGTTCTPTINQNKNISASFALATAGAPLQLIQRLPGGTQGTNNITGAWPSAQQAGDTNIVSIQFNNATTTVSSVTDSAGNTYGQLGGGCSPQAGNGFTTAVYIANNIVAAAAGANTVTVALSGSPTYRAILGHEYSGLQNPPLDVCNGATGGGSGNINAGNLVTTNASDLLFSTTVVGGGINTPSTGWTQQISFKGNDTEDRVVAATGTYNNLAPQTGVGFSSIDAAFKTTTTVPVMYSFNILCAGSGSGTVTTSGISLTCSAGTPSGSSSTQVAPGTVLSVVATPSGAGSSLGGFQGAGCTTVSPCPTSSITTNTTLTVTFNAAGQVAYFVNKSTGSNSNSGLCAVAGTPAGCSGPWQTFAKAASTAVSIGASGTVITFAPGNYDESVTLAKSGGNATTARLVFKCGSTWTVGGSNCRTVNINARNVNNVDIGALGKLGFELTNPGGQTVIDDIANNCNTTSGACNVGNSIHILGNYIHDVATGGCPSSGAIATGQHGRQQTDIQAIGNLIDNVATGASCSLMHGIYIVSPGAKIQNNVILRVAGGAIQYYDESCSGIVSNNTLLNGHFGIISYGSNGCPQGLNTYANNIIDNMTGAAFYNGFSSAGDCGPGKNSLFSNNMLNGNGAQWQQAQPACEIRQNTITTEAASATFVSYTGTASGNYQLKGTSIAINGGTAQCVTGGQNPCISPVDILNVSRPQRANFDIGAYELP